MGTQRHTVLSEVDMRLTSTHAEEGDRQAFARRDTEGGQEGTDVQGGLASSGLGCASACASQPGVYAPTVQKLSLTYYT